jgi:hypothetical protein
MAYVSRSMTPTEQRYTQIEKELVTSFNMEMWKILRIFL